MDIRWLGSLLVLLSCCLLGCPAILETSADGGAYANPLIYNDHVYERNIRTVQLYRAPVEESYPVLYKGLSEPLILEFDELLPQDQRESNFFVDIINCDMNWNPSGMVPIEFYEGFTQQRIQNFTRSSFTKIPYVHYEYAFPQEGEFFKRSGNYLIKVYRNSDPNDLVLTRRFVVVDSRIQVQSRYFLDGRIERQEFDQFSFEILYKGLKDVFNPATDLKVKVLQNFRWDNAFDMGRPQFQRVNSLEYQLNINRDFKGGQTFRRLNLRSVRFYSESMQDVEERENLYDVFLFADEGVRQTQLGPRFDRNGSYSVQVQEWDRPDENADYVRTHFALKRSAPFPENKEVYVFGRFSDWQCLPEFRMDWSEQYLRYQTDVLLKQGIYDYQYVVKYSDDEIPDERPLEGRRRLTENFYTLLVYFRAPGDRSDQLIGFQPFNYYE